MVRAIAHLALEEAARHRKYHASFRGFRVHALRRRSAPGTGFLVEVCVCVRFGRTIIECDLVMTTNAGALEPML